MRFLRLVIGQTDIKKFVENNSLFGRYQPPTVSHHTIVYKNNTTTAMSTLRQLFVLGFILIVGSATAQRGLIVDPANNSSVLDPNGDNYVSLDNSGFSNDGWYVDEFEIPMFPIPVFGNGDTSNDTQAGPNCGTTDLTVDSTGVSAYAALDANNNLIIRMRLADEHPSVEAYTVLIDTDGEIGTGDPNYNDTNAGFEIDITLIKGNSKGIYVYDIDGQDSCPNPLLEYAIADNFQVSIADEVSCGDEDYFYDFYVPFGDLTTEFGITVDSELQFVVVTNISGTCAMAGKISDIGGVDDTQYDGCLSCAFEDLASNQCPVPFSSLTAGGTGFASGSTPEPELDIPLKQGDDIINGLADPASDIYIDVFTSSSVLIEALSTSVNTDSSWSLNLSAPLNQGDSVVAVAIIPGNCDSQASGSQVSFAVVVLNTIPFINGTGADLSYSENDGQVPVDPAVTAGDDEDLDFEGATISISSGFESGEDALTFTDQLGITGGYNSGTGVLTLSGEASINDYNTALQSISYINNSEDPIESARTVEFIINDGSEDSAPFTRDIIVSKVNDPPVLSGTPGSTEYTTETPAFVVNSTFSIADVDNTQIPSATVLIVQSSSNTFVDGDELTFSAPAGIAGSYNSSTGVLSFTGSASLADYAAAINSVSYEYNPPGAANESTRRITFNVSDGTANSNFINHFITFNPTTNFPPEVIEVNGEPVVGAVDVTTNEDSSVEVCLTVNDPDGDLITVNITTPPINGTTGAIVESDGTFCFDYTPDADFDGTETITLEACDALGECSTTDVTINIDVLPINDPPIIAPSAETVNEKTTTQLCIDPGNITDIEGDSHVFSSGTSANGGTVADGTANDLCFNYTPPTGFIGSDEVEVTICDSGDPSVCSTTTIDVDVLSVNDSPVILVNSVSSETMTVQSFEDSVKVFCFAVIDVDGDNVNTLSINKISGNGTLIADATEFCYEYTPVPDENGIPSVWEITIEDDGTGNLTDVVTVTINLAAVNDFPTLDAIPDPASIDEDASEQSVNLAGITAGGGESQTLAISATSSNTSLIPDPTVTYTSANTSGSLAYTPVADQYGTATITVTADDGQTDNNTITQTFTVEVSPVNDPPVIDDVVYEVDEEVSTQVCVSVSDIENDPHMLSSAVITSDNATITDATAGDLCFVYTGNVDFVGQDVVEITVCDSNDGSVCTTSTITIDVIDVNEPPEIIINTLPTSSYSINGSEDVPIEFSFEVTDPEGDIVSTTGLNSISGNGTLTEIGTFTYEFTPDENYFGNSLWEIEICDDGNPQLCGKLQLTIIIDPVNDAPVATTDTLYVIRKERGTINVLDNDIDIENDPLSLELVLQENPTGGTVDISASGEITYTSDVTFRGEDKLVYTITDGGSPPESTTGTLIIMVDDNPFTVYQTISPNGDGMNDYWHIEGIDYYPNNSVRIYDRYNNLVFEMDGYNNSDRAWIGRSNRNGTKLLPEGTYFYRITAGEKGAFGGFVVLRGTGN